MWQRLRKDATYYPREQVGMAENKQYIRRYEYGKD